MQRGHGRTRSPPLALLAAVALLLAAASALGASRRVVADHPDTRRLTPELRSRGLRFAAAVAPADRAWILGALDQARPEARRLIDAVDGLVVVTTRPVRGDGAIAVAIPG